MGACLAKNQAVAKGKPELADISNEQSKHINKADSDVLAKQSTASDGQPRKASDSFRTKSLVGRLLSPDTDTKSGKGSKVYSRAKGNGKAIERPLQAMSSAELVEQYSLDASLLMSSAERIDKLLKERGMGPTADVGDGGHTVETAPQLGNHISSISADSRGQSVLADSPSTPSHGSIASPVQQARASSLGSLLTLDPSIAAISQDFESGRMLQVRQGLQRWCSTNSLRLSDLAPFHKILGFTIEELDGHCAKIEKCLELMRDESGYSTARDDGDLKVLYKCVKGKFHHVKMESTLPHPLERPLSLAREFDLMNSWNHYIIDSQLLYAPSIWQSYVYAAMWMPFPFPQMECLGTGRGYDLSLEDKSLMVAIESIEDHELPAEATKLTHKHKKRHRADVMPGSAIRFEALPPKKDGTPQTKGTILQIVNPHVPHVPSFIVNFVLGVLAPFAHRQIVKLLGDEFDSPDKPFPRRLAANPQLYQRVRDVVTEGLAHHYGYTGEQGQKSLPKSEASVIVV